MISGGREYYIWIGTSAKDNWDIIRESEPDDRWFHIAGLPSCHVILRHHGYLDDAIRTICAELCIANTSQCKKLNKATLKSLKIITTDVSNLTLGDKVGSVLIRDEKLLAHLRL